jgi:hypothetical protein
VETMFVVGNAAWNAGLVGFSAYFVKKWMDRVDKTIEQHKEELRDNAKLLTTQVEGVYIELRMANGRTAKLEGKMEVQKAICSERHDQ